MFVMILDRYLVAKGLVGTGKIVLNKPWRQPPIEGLAVRCQIPQGDEFILQGAVEPFIKRIVSRGLEPGMVMREMEPVGSFPEVLCEFGPIVRLEIFNLGVEEVMDAFQEISGMF